MNAPLALLTATLLLAAPRPQEATKEGSTRLEYRTEPGRVTPWRTTLTSQVEITAAATGRVESTLEIGGEFDIDLLGASSDSAGEVRQRMHLRRMQATIAADDDEPSVVEMDRTRLVNDGDVLLASEHPSIDALLASAFDGPTATFVLSPRGGAAAVEVDEREPVDPEMGNLEFGDEYPLLWPVLPEGPVEIGATWRGRRAIHSEYEFETPVQVELVHELVAVHGELATLRVTGRVEVAGPLAADSDEGRVVVEKLVFDVRSRVQFRVAEGTIESAEAEFTFDADMTGAGGDTAKFTLESKNRIALARRTAAPQAEPTGG